MKSKKIAFVAALTLGVSISAFGIAGCGEHKHDFSDEWKGDASGHYHLCLDGACGEKSEVLTHDYGEWTEVTAATEQAVGMEKRTCSTCDYTQVRETAKLNHRHTFASGWSKDNVNHWHDCTAAGCEEKGSLAAHSWNSGVVTTDPTETSPGVKTYTCTQEGCGATRTEPVPELTHAHSPAEEWSYNSTHHYKECSGASCTEHLDSTPHNLTESVTVAAKCEEAGVKTISCTVCDYSATEQISALTHSWGNWTIAHGNKPTAEAAGKATRTCTRENCGATDTEEITLPALTSEAYTKTNDTANCTEGGTATYSITVSDEAFTFTAASAAKGHSFAEAYQKDVNRHWHLCTECGARSESVSHTFPKDTEGQTVYTVTEQPTCTEKGKRQTVCGDCGHIREYDEAELGHDIEFVDNHNGTVTAACTRCELVGVTATTGGDKLATPLAFDLTEIKEEGYNHYISNRAAYFTFTPANNITFSITGEGGTVGIGTISGNERDGYSFARLDGKNNNTATDSKELTAGTAYAFQLFVNETGLVHFTVETHTHTYDTEQWVYDKTNHWHVSLCHAQTAPVINTAEHTLDNDNVCTVCGYEEEYQNPAVLTFEVLDEEKKTAQLISVSATTESGETADCVVIPEKTEIDGVEYTVTQIKHFAFSAGGLATAIKSIKIPATVTERPEGADYRPFSGTKFTAVSRLYVASVEQWRMLVPVVTGYTSHPLMNDTKGYKLYIGGELVENLVINTDSDIENYLFANCSSIKTVKVSASGSGATSLKVGLQAFKNCANLQSVTIGEGFVTIDTSSFESCTALKTVSLPDSLTTINASAFKTCSALTEIVLPKNLETIGNTVFQDCTNLTSVTILNVNTTKVGLRLFRNVSSISKVYFGGTAEEWNTESSKWVKDYLIPATATVYFLSEERPAVEGNFWHMAEGVPSVWASEE